jgi:hypothetical protein
MVPFSTFISTYILLYTFRVIIGTWRRLSLRKIGLNLICSKWSPVRSFASGPKASFVSRGFKSRPKSTTGFILRLFRRWNEEGGHLRPKAHHQVRHRRTFPSSPSFPLFSFSFPLFLFNFDLIVSLYLSIIESSQK